MACTDQLILLDDHQFALQLQLQEIDTQRQSHSGKWAEGSPPDYELAFENFEAEVNKAIRLVQDIRLAHSVAEAVDSDAAIIAQLAVEEEGAANDREMALSFAQDPEYVSKHGRASAGDRQPGAESVDWNGILLAVNQSSEARSPPSTVAGPSGRGAYRRTEAALETVSQTPDMCSICKDPVPGNGAVRVECGDIYCRPCLKDFFLRAAKDESLFPPRCHRNIIDFSLIRSDMSIEEINTYKEAEMEYTSTNRVYCASPQCAKHIPVAQRTTDKASCEACGTETCMHCKAPYHEGICLADEGRQSIIKLGAELGWQACFACGEMVNRYVGCDHMTCRCGAQFCYRCGVKWKNCPCSDWDAGLLNQRARELVDREADRPLVPAVRRMRVEEMERELIATHECSHQNKFTRLNAGRPHDGFRCEICGARHRKFILCCKLCHLTACNDCRMHRL
ncbi:hypothetical protein NLU13_6584 [Sarocladium strictum]|uniref:RBR-type E3 ubiquitin transferase n=1 Tax=Sarocladium strictum TaxID=5046 RepID=A0AA39L794_SARSR|nr:hypothetical protein NLU13_6584 [Sarocladium strictum]